MAQSGHQGPSGHPELSLGPLIPPTLPAGSCVPWEVGLGAVSLGRWSWEPRSMGDEVQTPALSQSSLSLSSPWATTAREGTEGFGLRTRAAPGLGLTVEGSGDTHKQGNTWEQHPLCPYCWGETSASLHTATVGAELLSSCCSHKTPSCI